MAADQGPSLPLDMLFAELLREAPRVGDLRFDDGPWSLRNRDARRAIALPWLLARTSKASRARIAALKDVIVHPTLLDMILFALENDMDALYLELHFADAAFIESLLEPGTERLRADAVVPARAQARAVLKQGSTLDTLKNIYSLSAGGPLVQIAYVASRYASLPMQTLVRSMYALTSDDEKIKLPKLFKVPELLGAYDAGRPLSVADFLGAFGYYNPSMFMFSLKLLANRSIECDDPVLFQLCLEPDLWVSGDEADVLDMVDKFLLASPTYLNLGPRVFAALLARDTNRVIRFSLYVTNATLPILLASSDAIREVRAPLWSRMKVLYEPCTSEALDFVIDTLKLGRTFEVRPWQRVQAWIKGSLRSDLLPRFDAAYAATGGPVLRPDNYRMDFHAAHLFQKLAPDACLRLSVPFLTMLRGAPADAFEFLFPISVPFDDDSVLEALDAAHAFTHKLVDCFSYDMVDVVHLSARGRAALVRFAKDYLAIPKNTMGGVWDSDVWCLHFLVLVLPSSELAALLTAMPRRTLLNLLADAHSQSKDLLLHANVPHRMFHLVALLAASLGKTHMVISHNIPYKVYSLYHFTRPVLTYAQKPVGVGRPG